MALTTPDPLYCTEADIEALLSVEGKENQVDDAGTGTLTVTEQGYITQARAYATEQCNFYLLPRYEAS